MREIKFRAWDKNQMEKARMTTQLYLNSAFFSKETLKDIEIMQYTGLKDKNGKEIYEGDILMPGKREVVYIQDRKFSQGVGFYTESHELKSGYWSFGKTQAEGSEIAGNIYENPKLICKKSRS